MVPRGGLEPPRPLGSTDFKSVASTIPPSGQRGNIIVFRNKDQAFFFKKFYKKSLPLIQKFRISVCGWMAERLKAPVLKTGEGETPSWVRIPLHPPLCGDFTHTLIFSKYRIFIDILQKTLVNLVGIYICKYRMTKYENIF